MRRTVLITLLVLSAAPSAQAQTTPVRIIQPATGAQIFADTIDVVASTAGSRPSSAGVQLFVNNVMVGSAQFQLPSTQGADGRWPLGPLRVGRFARGAVRVRVLANIDNFVHVADVNITRVAPPSTVNAFFTGVEVTQLIQGPRMISSTTRRTTDRTRVAYPPTESPTHVPLVAGKRTVLRLTGMVEGSQNQPIGPVHSMIQGFRNGAQLAPSVLHPIAPAETKGITLDPVNPSNLEPSINASRDTARNDASRSWNFTLPENWTHGELLLNIYVNRPGPNGDFVPECGGCADFANHFYLKIDFTASGRITVLPWQVQWIKKDGGIIARSTDNLPGFFSSIRQYFPIAETSLLTTNTYRGAVRVNAVPFEGSTAEVLSQTNATTTMAGVEAVEYTGHTSQVGVMSCNLVGIVDRGGRAERPGEDMVTMGPPCRPFTPAHELGHNTGLQHASCDHGEAGGGGCEGTFPIAHGGLGGVDAFDVYAMQAVPEPAGSDHLHDFMSYGDPEWVSRTNYFRLLNYLRTHRDFKPVEGLAVASQAKPRPAESMVVTGTADGGSGKILALYQTLALDRNPLPNSGPYRLVVRRADGSVLEDRRFEPAPGEGGTSSYTVVLPRHAEASSVELLHGETLLDKRTRSATPPTVKWTDPPQPKPLERTGIRNVAWTADDAEKDKLVYVFQYSRDGGKTWRSLDSNIPDLGYPLDMSHIEGTSKGRFRVLASDGFHTVADESDRVFPVPDKAPGAYISAPTAEITTTAGLPVSLAGSGSDVEDGALTGRRLQWVSGRDGEIGRGPAVLWSPPSIGRHVVTLIARDRSGQAGTARVVVNVLRDGVDRRAPRVRDARPKGRRVIVRFSEGVIGATARRVALRDARGRAVRATVLAEPALRRLVITPRRGAHAVRVVIARGLTDLAGNRLRPRRVPVNR